MDPQEDALRDIAARPPVIDVGAGGRVLGSQVITVDAVAYPGTRVVADLFHLPFRDHAVTGVVCTGTLEHVIDPPAAVREFERVLSADGVVHVEVPFIQPYHADPHDYWRFTHEGLAVLFARWRIVGAGSHMGSGAGAAWVLRDAIKGVARRRTARRVLHAVVSVLVQPLRMIDRHREPGLAASGYWLRAQPPGVSPSSTGP